MVFTRLSLKNALAVRLCDYRAVSEPLLPKVARRIPVLSSRYMGKCASRGLKRSGSSFNCCTALGKNLSVTLIKECPPGFLVGGFYGNSKYLNRSPFIFKPTPKIHSKQAPKYDFKVAIYCKIRQTTIYQKISITGKLIAV